MESGITICKALINHPTTLKPVVVHCANKAIKYFTCTSSIPSDGFLNSLPYSQVD